MKIVNATHKNIIWNKSIKYCMKAAQVYTELERIS